MKKKRNIFLILIFILLLIIAYFSYDCYSFQKQSSKEKTASKYVRVTFVEVDYNKTKNMDFYKDNSYMNYFLDTFSMEEELTKEGNYYVATIQNINKLGFERIKKITTGLNDTQANLVDDVKFDEETHKISIPSKYYEEEQYDPYKGATIRLEIVNAVTEQELNDISFDVKINKFFSQTKNVKCKYYYEVPKISVFKYSKGQYIKKDDLIVYLNGKKTPLNKKLYEWDSKTGVLSFNSYPFYINDVEIKVKKISLIKNFFLKTININTVYAADKSANVGTAVYDGGALSKDPSFLNEETAEKSVKYYYETSKGYYVGDGKEGKWVVGGEVPDSVTDNDILANSTSSGDDNRTAAFWSFYVYIDEVTFKKSYGYDCDSDGNNCNKTSTAKVTITVNEWLRSACANEGTGNEEIPILLPLTFKLKVEDDGKYYVSYYSTETVTTQTAAGGFRTSGATYKLKIQKKHYVSSSNSMEDWKKKNIVYRIYTGFSTDDQDDCNGDIFEEKKTNSKGIVTFSGLPSSGTYCVKEILNEKSEGSVLSGNNYTRDANCDGVANKVLKAQTTDLITTNDSKNTYCNIRKLYSFTIKKRDAESLNLLPGAKFKVTTDTVIDISGTHYDAGAIVKDNLETGADGSITVCGLPEKTNYTITETGAPNNYWIDEPTTISVPSSELTAYDSNKACSSGNEKIKDDHKQYYCLKVKKVDKTTGQLLKGASFATTISGTSVTKKDSDDGADDGVTSFFLGANPGTYNVIEKDPPIGYAKDDRILQATAILLPRELNYNDASAACLKADAVDYLGNNITAQSIQYEDSKLLINWYKVTENAETKANGAQFNVKIKDTNQYIQTDGTIEQTDASGVTKTCYKYSNTVEGEASASKLTSMNTNTNGTTTDGEVCVAGLPEGNYTVTEIQPAQYHTFNSTTQIHLSAATTYGTMSDDNKLINLPTEFEFTKEVESGDGDQKIVVNGIEKTLSDLTTEELMQIEFNVFDKDGNMLEFVETEQGSGIYEYTGNVIDPPVGTSTSALHLNRERKISIKHLPWGQTYSIKEKETKVCNSASDYDKCIGYYYPDYSQDSSHQFTITNVYNSKASKSLINTPTKIEFTKKDYYKYEDASDIVDFENDKERNDFDRITFKLKDANGKYLTLKFIGNVGTCKDDESYSEYRYVYSDSSEGDNGTELHTCGGHIKITNLCRGNTYRMEEVAVPADSVFVKENTTSTPTEVEYKVGCTIGEDTEKTQTKLIYDKGTRVRFEKRDSKYGYLIPDETTTFKVYRCPKGETECHPTDYSTDEEREKAGMKLVKFAERAVIEGDEEDKVDAEDIAGVEVYTAMSDSDASGGKKYVTELHPYKGILVLRYLQSGYTYQLLETVAPKNYQLPLGKNAETKFTVTNETVKVDVTDVPNKPTSLLIRKYSDDGSLLPGAEFKIYEKNSCDPNITAKAQLNNNATLLKLKTIRDGVYESRPVTDTEVVTTCTDREDEKCSDIKGNGEITKLTYSNYLENWSDFDDESTSTEDGTKIELQEGEALVQYLEYGHCYIIEETKAPKGYSLPEDEEDRYTMVTIEENSAYAHDTLKALVNKPTPFTFYKYDEFNQLLDGAEFKLQKLDDNKKYHDVTVTKEEKEGKVYYKVDENTDNVTITTINGSATVYYLESGQYRIVETKAAPGKELTKNPNIATFFVDESGNVYGNSIIVNKGKTERIEVKNSASAELVVNIQTGQTVIKYGLIITILISLITGLMIVRKKMK